MRLAISFGRPRPTAMAIFCDRHRYAPRIRTDNFRAAPLDTLQVDVFRAFVETLPISGGRDRGDHPALLGDGLRGSIPPSSTIPFDSGERP